MPLTASSTAPRPVACHRRVGPKPTGPHRPVPYRSTPARAWARPLPRNLASILGHRGVGPCRGPHQRATGLGSAAPAVPTDLPLLFAPIHAPATPSSSPLCLMKRPLPQVAMMDSLVISELGIFFLGGSSSNINHANLCWAGAVDCRWFRGAQLLAQEAVAFPQIPGNAGSSCGCSQSYKHQGRRSNLSAINSHSSARPPPVSSVGGH